MPNLSNKLNKKTTFILLTFIAVFLVVPESAYAYFGLPTSIEGWVDFFNIGTRTLMEIIILPLAAGIFSLVGLLFDTAVEFSLHTAYIFSLSPAINLGWVIVRDIANIFFIFILIYISLGTIVRGTVGFHTKDLLTKVIIAALLINFSLFFTKVVIDVSNIFGGWIYNGVVETLKVNKAENSTKNPSLTDLINKRLGIIQLWSGGSNATDNANTANKNFFNNPENSTIGQFIRLATVLIATYIFAYCAIMFLARSITLLFLMVFSPIGFMGGLLPQLKKHADRWREELLSAAIFPVAFMLMLYISLQFINSLQLLNIKTSDNHIFSSDLSLYFQYFIIIFLLHATLKIAKENSGEMGKALGGLADGLGKLAVGVAGGGAAILGKMTIGAAAAGMANSTRLNQMVAGGGITGFMAGGVKSRLSGVADYHFDTRAALGLGMKGEKGYTTMIKDMTKEQEEAQKSIAPRAKELIPAKEKLEKAEENAYGKHIKLGDAYKDASEKFKTAESTGRKTEKDRKDYNEAQKDLRNIKTAIDQDPEYEIQKKILIEQEELLKEMKEDKKIPAEVIRAMEAGMRQGRAARETESGFGMSAAQMMNIPLGKKQAQDWSKNIKEQIETIKEAESAWGKAYEAAKFGTAATLAATGTITGIGLGKWSAAQYVADNKKIAVKLRDVMKEAEKKKSQDKIKDILAGLEETGGATPPTPPATGPTVGPTTP